MWDGPLPAALKRQWKDVLVYLSGVSMASIHQLVTTTAKPVTYQLITFCSAFTHIYAAATYLPTTCYCCTRVNLMFSKMRLARTAKRAAKDSALTIP